MIFLANNKEFYRDETMDNGKSLESIRNIILKYSETLKRNGIDPERIYLFGSHATGTQREHSDIDLAIVSNDITGNRFQDRELLMLLRRSVDLRIEPHPFLPEEFISENPEAEGIIKEGVLCIDERK
jgi:uncharacterized protein